MSTETRKIEDAAAHEAALKLELLEIQVAEAKHRLEKTREDDTQARQEAALRLRSQKASARKAEIDLENAERESAKARAEAAESRNYTFVEPVTWDSTKVAIAELGKISRRFPKEAITITLNSPGGSVIAGLALYDHIQELRGAGHHVTVKVRGMAASMGGILLQAGDTRVIGPEALVLIHEVSSGTSGKIGEMKDDVAFSSKLWDKLAKILAKRSSMTAKAIKEKAHKYDWWLDAREAIKLGFADEIG